MLETIVGWWFDCWIHNLLLY